MFSKRMLAVFVLVLFGILGLASTSIAELRAGVQPLAGCGSDCSGGQSCYLAKCPCSGYPYYLCMATK